MLPVKILFFVENYFSNQLVLKQQVEASKFPYEYVIISSFDEVKTTLTEQSFDVAILSTQLSEQVNLELLAYLETHNIPVIVIVNNGDEETAILYMQQGASDFLVKDNENNYFKLLPICIQKVIQSYQAKSQIKQQKGQWQCHSMNGVCPIANIPKIDIAPPDSTVAADFFSVNEQRLSLALTAAKAGVWEWNMVTGEVIWSDESYRLLGYEPGGCISSYETWLNAVYPSDREQVHQKLQKILNECSSIDLEVRIQLPDGSIRWLHNLGHFIVNGHNEIGIIGIQYDITERKHQEYLLTAQRKVLEFLVQDVPLSDILQFLVQIVESQFIGIFGAILLLREQHLFLGAGPSLPEMVVQAIRNGILIGAQGKFCNIPVIQPTTYTACETICDPFWDEHSDLLIQYGLRSCWSVPIFAKSGDVLGTFAMYCEGSTTPKLNDWELLDTIVNLASLAIERKYTEEELNRNEERFRATFEQAAVGMCHASLDGKFLLLNQRFCDIVGYSSQELLSLTFQEITHPDDLGKDLSLMQQLLRGKISTYTLEKRYICKDRKIVWGNLTMSLFCDTSGNPLYLIGVVENIMHRKEAEAALVKSEAINRLLIQSIPDRLIWLRQDGFYIDAQNSERAKQLHQNLSSRRTHLSQMLPPELVDQWMHYTHLALSTQQIQCYEQQVVLGNESRYEEVRIIPAEEDEVLAIVRDITDRKMAEFALQKSEEQFRQLSQALEIKVEQRTIELQQREAQLHDFFDNATDLIQSVAPNGQILFVNRAWRETLGYTDDDLQQISLYDIIHPDSHAQYIEILKHVLDGVSYTGIESKFVTKNAQEIWVEGNLHCRLEKGQVTATQGIFRDITKRKRAKQQLQNLSDRLTLAITSGQIGIWEWDIVKDEVIWDDRMYQLYGVNRSDFANAYQAWLHAVHPDDQAEAALISQSSLQGGQEYNTEFRVIHADGSVHYIHARALIQRDREGKPQRMIGINYDVSERKATELAIQQQAERERLLRTVTEQIHQSLDLHTVLIAGVTQIRQFLQADRVLIFQIQLDSFGLGKVVEEAVAPGWQALLGQEILDPCFTSQYLEQYCRGKISITTDIEKGEMTPCYADFLRQFQVQANLAVPILQGGHLWGLLIAHQCAHPRQWTTIEVELLEQLSNQIGIAIRQANLFHQVETELMERRQVEAALRISEERYITLAGIAPVGIFRTDAQGNCLYVNENWSKIAGLSLAEAIGLGWTQALHPDDQGSVATAWYQAAQSDEIFCLEYRFQRPDGEVTWVFGRAIQEKDKEGKVTGYVGTVTDINERKQMEMLFRQQLEKEQLLVAILQHTRDSFDLNEILGAAVKQVRELLQSDRVLVYQLFEDGSGKVIVESNTPPWRSLLDLTFSAEVFPSSCYQRYVQGTATAINNQAEARECMTQFMQDLQIQSELIVPIVRRENEQLWGLLIAQQCSELKQWQAWEVSLLQQLTNQLAIAVKQSELYYQLKVELGERRQAETNLQNANQELQIVNAELARATRLKDEFLANMSHELRTPLNAILGMAESLIDQVLGQLNDRQIRAITMIENSGQHLLELINDILDLAKIESGKLELHMEPTSVKLLCSNSVNFVKQLAYKKNIQLKMIVPEQISRIEVDERRIRQVLINLLNNAVKFTPEGGLVTLEVKCHLAQQIIQFSVTDTGIGIAPEDIPKLFQSFSQIDSRLNRQYEGTGLGLALVKRIIELHQGQVEVTSTITQGSCFTIALPYRATTDSDKNQLPKAANPVLEAFSQPAVYRQSLVLLAEDNPANTATLTNYITAYGYQMIVANDGQEAVDLAKAQQPEIILMDIQMPKMDGLEAIKQIRAIPELANVPIIALTALAMPGDKEKCIRAGANYYISKPFSLKGLVHLIGQLLGS